jgi:hypothetical protein
MNRRILLSFFVLANLLWLGNSRGTAFAEQPLSLPKTVKVYEYTFIKSLEAKPDKAIEYIVKNWFALDKIATEQGLLLEYNMFEANAEEKAEWNIVVAVGYPTEQGSDAIMEQFNKIRQQHKKVLVDSKEFKELATIVGSRKMFPQHQSNNQQTK